MICKPHKYQQHATQHIMDNAASGLFMEMGLGKTLATLTAVDLLLNQELAVNKVLVIAPKRVAEEVWPEEVQKWDHLQHLKISLVAGTERKRKEALKAKADIYVIGVDNVAWLVALYGGSFFPFDMVVLDEISKFKNPSSSRFKSMKMVRPFIKRVVGLTGTPAPNSLVDLWSQIYLLDQGQRLEKTIGAYKTRYFVKNPNGFGSSIRGKDSLDSEEIELLGADYYSKKIFNKIDDICISMKSEDYLELPERIDRVVNVKLKSETRKKYNDFEKDQILAMGDTQITAVNAGALCTKLLQYANGALYDEDRNVHEVHDEKLEELEDIIDVANGQPVLVFYAFQHDLARIKKRLKKFNPVEYKGPKTKEMWNKGDIQVMLAHPASAGHGLNLQAGGNIIVWFGLPWSLELYQQANARLHRQGQTKPVIIHHLVAVGTMDEDVMDTLATKAHRQEALMQAVKARIQKYLKQTTQ